MSSAAHPFHLAFPFGIANGLPRAVSLQDYIPQLIEQILFTAPGERVNRPVFGCGVLELVFHPLDTDTTVAVQQMLQAQLQQFIAAYAEILALEVTSRQTELIVTVRFRDLAGGGPQQVVISRPLGGGPE